MLIPLVSKSLLGLGGCVCEEAQKAKKSTLLIPPSLHPYCIDTNTSWRNVADPGIQRLCKEAGELSTRVHCKYALCQSAPCLCAAKCICMRVCVCVLHVRSQFAWVLLQCFSHWGTFSYAVPRKHLRPWSEEAAGMCAVPDWLRHKRSHRGVLSCCMW